MRPIASALNTPYRPVKLGRDDIADIVALERECFAVPWSATQYHQAFGHKTFVVYGLRADGCLAAYLAYAELTREMEIFNLGVRAAHRRQGLAKALLGRVLARCAKLGVREGFLEVRASNLAALNLYGMYGFTVAGRRKNYYPDNSEDALVMRLDIPCPG
ncbi:MAG: ribosomal protein S18-alanine N-acetyltransferase [Desulfovibrionaceae bacterium]|nr:ribosomal protein S18-alanine N-acetyltransferase [Desulfovibrionaceae bacterium]MBF0514073.1 ribosomal protein S18-alanine N-acetyltransferase [Desulfovibrionaceae bacterium]